MDIALFKKLEVCDAEQSWEYCRDIVAVQLMGKDVFPVPFLREASSFDTGHVVLKSSRTALEKLTGTIPSAVVIGHLSNFITDGSKETLVERLSSVQKDRETNLNQLFEFHEDDMKFGVRKSLTVQLLGCQKYTVEYPPHPGEFTLDLLSKDFSDKDSNDQGGCIIPVFSLPKRFICKTIKPEKNILGMYYRRKHANIKNKGFVNVDKVYLISDVYYVMQLKIHLVIGKDEDDFTIKGKIPIGFSLVRYKLASDCSIQQSKPARASKWRVHWAKKQIRDKNDPLPPDPSQTSIVRDRSKREK